MQSVSAQCHLYCQKSTLFPTGSNSLRNEGCLHITGENHESRGSRCPGNFLQCRWEWGECRTRPSALEPLLDALCHTALKGCARQCSECAGNRVLSIYTLQSQAPNSVTDACSGHLPTFKFFVLQLGDLAL